jgi:hypothetical protein
MPMEKEPVVGASYVDPDGISFEILDFDEDEGIIEIQYADESVSDLDIDAWYEMDLRRLKPVAGREGVIDDDFDESSDDEDEIDNDEFEEDEEIE